MTLRITFAFIIVWATLLMNPPVYAASAADIQCLSKVTYVKIAVSMKMKGYTEKEVKDVLQRFYDEIEDVYDITDGKELSYFFDVIEQCKSRK